MTLHGLRSVTIGVPNALFAWGPPPPPSFLHPDDLATMMTGTHSTR